MLRVCAHAPLFRTFDAPGAAQRPVACVVEFQDASGAKQRLTLDGLQARIFQHEYDHLQGTLFQDRMSAEVLATVQPQLAALEAEWKQQAKRR